MFWQSECSWWLSSCRACSGSLWSKGILAHPPWSSCTSLGCPALATHSWVPACTCLSQSWTVSPSAFCLMLHPVAYGLVDNIREILVEMVKCVTPGHCKFWIAVWIMLEHLKKNIYCYIMARLWDKTMSHLKYSKMKVWELSLVCTLSWRNTTTENKCLKSLSPQFWGFAV